MFLFRTFLQESKPPRVQLNDMKHLLFTAAFLFAFFIAPAAVYACSCMAGGPEHAFNNARAVFIGRMVGATERLTVRDENDKPVTIEAGTVRFDVEELFKGSVSSESAVFIDSMDGTSCGPYGLKRGERYVVYAYDGGRDEKTLSSGVCTRTAPVNAKGAEDDLKFLRSLPPAGAGGTIEGRLWIDTRVRNAGGAARPLAGVKVLIRGENNAVFTAMTDEKGEFVVKKLKEGKYRVEPQFPAGYYTDQQSDEVSVADRGTVSVGFEAYHNGFVAGRVVDRSGRGFNSIFLHFVAVDEKTGRETVVYGHSSGENGDFDIEGVPPGDYTLYLEMRRDGDYKERKYFYPGTFKPEESVRIKVGPGGKVEGLNFLLPDEYRVKTIEGRVFWPDGKPASGVEVLLICPQGLASNGYRVEFSPTRAETDDEGRFTIEGFAGQTYWLEARGQRERAKKGEIESKYAPAGKIALADDVRDLKLILSKNGLSGGCGDSPDK
jgi:hypothetical protein